MWFRQAGMHIFYMLYSADSCKKWVALRFLLYDSYRCCFLMVWFTPMKTLCNEKLSTLWNGKVGSFFVFRFVLFFFFPVSSLQQPTLSIWRLLTDFSTVHYISTQLPVLSGLHVLLLILRDHLPPSLQVSLESLWCLASVSRLLTLLHWSFLGL